VCRHPGKSPGSGQRWCSFDFYKQAIPDVIKRNAGTV
jgi:hypothetical protein